MSMLSVLGQVLRVLFTGKMLLGKPELHRDWRLSGAPVARATEVRSSKNIEPEPPAADDLGWTDAGKPAPLLPRPGHHLVAANALPPSDRTYLLPKD